MTNLDWLDAQYMQNVLQMALKKPDLNVERIEVGSGANAGDGLAGLIMRVNVFFKNNEKMSVIAKLKPESKMLDSLSDGYDVFEIEAHFFTEILKRLNAVRKQSIPTVYFVDFKHEVILMEDLKAAGFSMQTRGQYLDLQQAMKALEALAVFHGASYYVFENDPTLKEKYKHSLWREFDHPFIKGWVDNGLRAMKKWAANYGLNESQTKKLVGFRDYVMKNWNTIWNEKKPEYLNLLSHGDIWINNLMFHSSGEVYLIDFPMISYDPFGIDIHFLLFSSLQSKLLVENIDKLLECYYNKLKEVAPDIPNLTLERVKREFHDKYLIGMVVAFVFRVYVVADAAIDMDALLDENKVQDAGFDNEIFINDVRTFLPFFEKIGVL